MEKIILDTNILIEILKNNPDTIKEVEKYTQHYISSITKMELFYGARDKKELEQLNEFVSLFTILPLSENISKLAENLVYKYAKSHTLDIPDALIAATSLTTKYKLFTYNKKDFKYIDNINLCI